MPGLAKKGGGRRRRGGVTPTHSILGAGRGWVVSSTIRPFDPLERTGTNHTGGRVGIEAVLDGTENLSHTGIRSPDRSARSV